MEKEEDEDVVAEPLVITVEFLAKPWPDTISWYSDLGNGTRLAIEEEAGLEYVQGGLEAVGAEHSHQLATTLTITNLTHNLRQQYKVAQQCPQEQFGIFVGMRRFFVKILQLISSH